MALNQVLNECHVYKNTKLRKKRKRNYYSRCTQDVEAAAKALVVNELMAIFHAGHRKS